MQLFMNELSGALKGERLKEEEYSFYEYIADEKIFEKTAEYEENRKFFADMLGEFEKSSVIEPDNGGKETNGTVGRVSVPFDYCKVSDFCKDMNLTPAALLLAAASYTVSRFINERNVYISTISNGRSDMRTSSTYGMFVNTLPLGIKIGEGTTVAFIKHCFDVFSGVIEHEKYPFARIASDYDYEPEIMYEYQIGVVGDEIPCEQIGLEYPKFKLSIRIEEIDGQANITLCYNNALYSKGLMSGMAHAILMAAKAMISSPEAPVRSIELCSDKELAVLDAFNEEAVNPYDRSDSVISMFRRAAKDNPDRTAIIFEDRKYSYRETDDLSERIASYIGEHGLGRGNVVSILIPKGEYMAIASFGVLKSGAAYQPLDPSYPSDRLNYMVKNSGAGMLITIPELRPLLSDFDGEVLLLEDIPNLPMSGNVTVSPEPSDLFILLYTSGSTGIPKGVKLTHGNLVCFINWYHRYYDLKPEDCVGQYASFGFMPA